MKVLKFEIQNYKALAGTREVVPEGSSFFLVGGNGKGKTSAGRALIDLLTKKYPSHPVTEGEHEGFVQVTFDDGSQLLTKFEDGKKPKITFLTSEGHRIATPADFFKEMTGEGMTFDIDHFLSLAPKPRREMLEKMVGVDLTRLNLDEVYAMEDAREIRAELRAAKARVKPYDEKKADEEPMDVVELSKKIGKAKEVNKEIEYLKTEITGRLDRIRRLEAEIEEQRLAIKKMQDQKLKYEPVDEFELAIWEDDLAKADETNQAIRHAKAMHKEHLFAENMEAKLRESEEEVKRIRQAKEDEIRSKPLPATGLEFDPDGDGILLNGLPFEDAQVATSAKMIAALQIAEAQLGKIRYLHFDAAILDRENAMRVLEWAESRDLQLCIERPLWDGGDLRMEVYDRTESGELVKAKEVAV